MLKIYRRKLLFGLMTLQLLFLIIFTFAFMNLLHNRPIIDIGLPSTAINGLVIIFSVVSMFNIVYELTKVK